LEATHFGIYSSGNELMDTSNTSGRDLKCSVLLSSEKLISYIKIHLPQSRVLKIIQNGFPQASPCSYGGRGVLISILFQLEMSQNFSSQ
jgi:hypothetical protein